MGADRVAVGQIGEDLACLELEHRGYAIIARRYRTRMGEIDIVARDGKTMVFVEVKARESRRFGEAVEAVTLLKRRRIVMVAQEYLVTHTQAECPCRFDVVSVHLGEGHPVVEVYRNAFDATC